MNNETMVCNTCGQGDAGCGNNNHGKCGGGACGAGGYHRNFLLRLVIGIIILMIVFSLGVKIGEFKGMFGDAYGDRWMMQRQYQPRSMMLDQRTVPLDSDTPVQ